MASVSRTSQPLTKRQARSDGRRTGCSLPSITPRPSCGGPQDGTEEIVAIGSGRVIGYDAKTGEERWSREMPNGSIISSHAFADDMVFTQTYSAEVVPSFDDLLKKSDKDGNGVLSGASSETESLAASSLHSAAWRGLAMVLSTAKNGRKCGGGLESQPSRPSV